MGILTEEEIFVAAIEKPRAERASFLDQACGGDDSLRAQVEALLAAHDHPDSLLEIPACKETIATPFRMTESAGTIIGPYKLLQQIGEGGMGVVYMAEQTEPVERRVALKIIKPGMDTRQVIARFEAERQALAMMDHPNIAKVLDAGATDSGRPYFVMELVKGVPITQYCDERRLTPKQRLELFLPVLQAVQHAHQKGIIHRDIKPSNVLVAEYDDRPVPKVIDFGVAKATSQKLTEKTMFTEFGQLVGTLDYMSPEQAKLNQMDIDTRSDIYSLGVLLYELLTGDTPFDRSRLRSAAFEEMIRIIREEEPPKPSTRLSSSAMLASVSANRNTEPRKLSTLVRGELDWIVMKALDKDRGRRYETANGFAADLQRYLDNEPVEACPPSAGYKFRKFVGRNLATLTTAMLIVTVLVAATGISTWQAVRTTQALRSEAAAHKDANAARTKEASQRIIADRRRGEADEQREEADRQREQAEVNLRKAREAVDQMLTRVSEERLAHVPQMELLRRSLLEDALRFYDGFLHQSGTDAELEFETAQCYRRMGVIRYNLNRHDDQVAQDYHRSIEILERLVMNSRPNKSECEAALSESYQLLGHWQHYYVANFSEAEHCYRKALALQERLAAEQPDSLERRNAVVTVMRPLAGAMRKNGHPVEAEQVLRRSLEVARKLVADSPPKSTAFHYALAASHFHLGQHLNQAQQTTEAETEYRQAIVIFQQLVELAPHTEWFRESLGESQWNLAGLLVDVQRPDEAEPIYRQSVAHYAHLADDFPHFPEYRRRLAMVQFKLGQLLASCERLAEAEELYRRALQTSEGVVTITPDDHDLWSILTGAEYELNALLKSGNRLQEIEGLYRQSVVLGQRLVLAFPERADLLTKLVRSNERLATSLTQAERYREAEQVLRDALTFIEQRETQQADEDGAKAIVSLRLAHAQVQANLGHWDDARADVSKAADLSPKAGEQVLAYAVWCRTLGDQRASKNELDTAAAAYQEAVRVVDQLATRDTSPPQCRRELASCQSRFASLLARQGRQSEAEQAYRQALATREQLVAASPEADGDRHELAQVHFALARLLWSDGQTQKAEDHFQAGLRIEEHLGQDTNLSAERRLNWAARHLELGHAMAAAGRAESAEQAYRQSSAITEQVPGAWEHLGGTTNNLAAFLAATGQYEEAEQLFHKALELQQKAVERSPERPYSRQELAGTYFNLGLLLATASRTAEAEESLRQALSLWEQLVSEVSTDSANNKQPYSGVARVHNGLTATWVPGRHFLHTCLANTLRQLAGLAYERNEPAEAERLLEQALDHHQSALDSSPAEPRYRRYLLNHYALTIQHFTRFHQDPTRSPEPRVTECGLPGIWENYYRAAGALAGCASDVALDADLFQVELNAWERVQPEQDRELLTRVFRRAGRHPEDAFGKNNLAWLLATHPVLAVRDPVRAFELAKQAVIDAPQQAAYWNTCGVASFRNADWRVAIESLEKAERLAAGKYQAFNGFFLAMAHWQLGEQDEAHQWFDQSVAWMEKNEPANEELFRFRAEAAELLGVAEQTSETEK